MNHQWELFVENVFEAIENRDLEKLAKLYLAHQELYLEQIQSYDLQDSLCEGLQAFSCIFTIAEALYSAGYYEEAIAYTKKMLTLYRLHKNDGTFEILWQYKNASLWKQGKEEEVFNEIRLLKEMQAYDGCAYESVLNLFEMLEEREQQEAFAYQCLSDYGEGLIQYHVEEMLCAASNAFEDCGNAEYEEIARDLMIRSCSGEECMFVSQTNFLLIHTAVVWLVRLMLSVGNNVFSNAYDAMKGQGYADDEIFRIFCGILSTLAGTQQIRSIHELDFDPLIKFLEEKGIMAFAEFFNEYLENPFEPDSFLKFFTNEIRYYDEDSLENRIRTIQTHEATLFSCIDMYQEIFDDHTFDGLDQTLNMEDSSFYALCMTSLDILEEGKRGEYLMHFAERLMDQFDEEDSDFSIHELFRRKYIIGAELDNQEEEVTRALAKWSMENPGSAELTCTVLQLHIMRHETEKAKKLARIAVEKETIENGMELDLLEYAARYLSSINDPYAKSGKEKLKENGIDDYEPQYN